MVQTTVTMSGVEVASTPQQCAQINIHIHQDSAVTQLMKAIGSLKQQFFSHPWDTGTSKTSRNHGQLVLGVTQIFLGVVSCALGACLSFGPKIKLHRTGCAFWAGAVAIVAGIGTIVHEKHQGTPWGYISRLLTLAGIATAVAAVVLGVRSLIVPTDDKFLVEYLDWNMYMCSESIKNMFFAFCILLTVVWNLKIIVFVIALGLSFRNRCGQSSQPMDEEGSEKKLLENSVPPSPVKKIPVIL